MKKIILLLAIVLFASCDKEEPDAGKGQLDPNATITIRPATGVQLRATVPGLTALEIVEQAVNIKWQSHYFGNTYRDDAASIARTFIEEHKDYENQLLKMWGVDVISQDGEYYRDFTYGFNVVITDVNNDTIAYVPDAVINTARPLIEAAYEDENYTEVYRLFDEAFTFLPVSSE